MRWKAFELDPAAPDKPTSKIEKYMSRWGWDRDDVMRMSVGMQQNFTNHGLPYSFTERGMVANTRDAHRVLAWCAAVSPAAQDKAVEVLFKGYFGDERAPNDPSLLVDACVAAGKPRFRRADIP